MDLVFGKEKGYQTGLTGIGANRHALPQGVNLVKCKIIPDSHI